MIYQQAIARRYAKGLLLAVEKDNFDRITQDLLALTDMLLSESLKRLFEDPAFSPAERRSVINRIAEQWQMNPELHRFLLLLVNKDRILLLPLIYQAITAIIDEQRGRLRAQIKSASQLDQALVDDIKESLSKITKKEVMAEVAVDPSLIGGIRVDMGGTVFDGTVKARLSAIRNKLVYQAETI